jgi:hypothetical protein
MYSVVSITIICPVSAEFPLNNKGLVSGHRAEVFTHSTSHINPCPIFRVLVATFFNFREINQSVPGPRHQR